LIAIGKLPRPIRKKPNEEHVIQVRLRLNWYVISKSK
jgi:hypothetical protein